MVQSRVPYGLWSYAALCWTYTYNRVPSKKDCITPFFKRLGKESSRVPSQIFGQGCFYLAEGHEKFAESTRLGVILGYGQLGSWDVLDVERYTKSRGQAQIVRTRDVRFPAEIRFPLQSLEDDPLEWVAEMIPPDP